jgi:hypothetical protein
VEGIRLRREGLHCVEPGFKVSVGLDHRAGHLGNLVTS